MTLKSKSTLVFASVVLFAALTLAEIALFLFHHFAAIVLEWLKYPFSMTANDKNVVFATALSLFFIFLLIKMIGNMGKQLFLSKKWYTAFLLLADEVRTQHMNVKYPELGNRILVIKNEEFIALTIGFIKPKIVLSTFVIEHFSEAELRAILFHEQFHAMQRDPLKLMLIKTVSEQLGYIPLIKHLAQYYRISRELLADQHAMRKMKNSTPLGNVLLKVAEMGEHELLNEGAAHFAKSPLNYRIMQMLEPQKDIAFSFFHKKLWPVSLALSAANVYIFLECAVSLAFCHTFFI
ncbi:M56 family metallopeptidase [Anoxybacillus rupiensis]|jgi:beta-lactamase regulating signal transducer with metallopeptidase domain|uniref:M56 family metallopeptidase n=1 Tax=Anoxybacteroides rupiense TaxID=311460 RepID=A0ABT5W820_9BACL|nr:MULTISPECIES: M56 family metallopeptidase [Anoxybacillus]KXG10008.1 Protease HtpX [Anoxybacillus sp. P3H1B]MBB3907662.1 beta-lactamase regulating signal transducer with metallopeptidase domain [Anoxybacillus rupiensis]MBS2771674.1 M48 family metalloprotease [Anoxybacillus rupiensis]MDE8564236.1 M56 family metallopeptidase [Anoxybacillus rupiensis]OQM46465.1 peptidase M56 BlaR1 [Anoxybacillus sp. UARK-01]